MELKEPRWGDWDQAEEKGPDRAAILQLLWSPCSCLLRSKACLVAVWSLQLPLSVLASSPRQTLQ